jgi:hypothetical protein
MFDNNDRDERHCDKNDIDMSVTCCINDDVCLLLMLWRDVIVNIIISMKIEN